MLLWFLHFRAWKKYRTTIAQRHVAGNERLELWRSLSIETSTTFNPFTQIAPPKSYPPNLESEYFPDQTVQVHLDGNPVDLDVIPNGGEDFEGRAWVEIGLLQSNQGINSTLGWACSYFVQAGWAAFHAQQPERALRFFLNAERLRTTSGLDGIMQRNFGLCHRAPQTRPPLDAFKLGTGVNVHCYHLNSIFLRFQC